MTGERNFDVIEEKIRVYKSILRDTESKKERLNEVLSSCADLRKNRNDLNTTETSAKITALNGERAALKTEISELKKKAKVVYKETETLIFKGISENYSEIYDNQLSRLYGYKIDVIAKKIGDDFDPYTCMAEKVVVTGDKTQHGKVLRMISFGLHDRDRNRVIKKAVVEVCCYMRKTPAGTVVPYDTEMFGKL